jgi:hypothetical protein
MPLYNPETFHREVTEDGRRPPPVNWGKPS